MLFPMQDEAVQLVAYNTQQLAQIYTLVTQEWDIVQWANDKRRTYHMAQEIDVPFPRTFYPANEDDLTKMDIPFPAIIKPAISTYAYNTVYISKPCPFILPEELLLQYRRAVEFIHPDEVMVQEIIPGEGRTQYSLAAFCKEGRILVKYDSKTNPTISY